MIIPEWLFIEPERIPNRRDQDYFDLYEIAQLKQTLWYQQLFNFISRCLYFMTGPKFVVPILGNVLDKVNSLISYFLVYIRIKKSSIATESGSFFKCFRMSVFFLIFQIHFRLIYCIISSKLVDLRYAF